MFRSFSSTKTSPLAVALLLSGVLALSFPAFSSISFLAGGPVAFWLLFRQDWPASWVFVGVLGLVLVVPKRPFPKAWSEGASGALEWIERHLSALCVGVFVLLCALSWLVTRHVALSMDEYSVLLQSQIFASGHLKGHLPPEILERSLPIGFRGWFIHVSLARGDWVSSYWPGCALLMTPFAALGAPWAFNPAITALSVGAMWRVSRRVFASEFGLGGDDHDARAKLGAAWATLLFACSPVVIVSAWSYYTMPAHLLFNLLFCGALLRGNRQSAFVAGLLGGFALCIHNPAPHALFALPFLVWLVLCRRDLLLPIIAGYLIFFPFLYFGWNHYLNGYDVPMWKVPDSALPPGVHVPRFGGLQFPTIYIVIARIEGICKLWLWGVPALLVLAGSGWTARRAAPVSSSSSAPRAIPVLRLSGYALVLTLIGYSFVPFDQGHGWGFRYLHQLYFLFPWLAARYLTDERARQFPRLALQTALLCALSLAVLLPLRAWQAHDWIAAHQAQIIEPPANAAGIVFVDTEKGSYSPDLIQNDPFGRGPVWHLTSETPAQNAAFAHRFLRGAHLWKQNPISETWTGSALSTVPLPPSGQ